MPDEESRPQEPPRGLDQSPRQDSGGKPPPVQQIADVSPGQSSHQLQWLRQELDLWNEDKGTRSMPQPRDFGIELADLRPSEVDWGVKGPRLSIAKSDDRLLVYCSAGCSMVAVITALRALDLWANDEDGPQWRRFRYTREIDLIVIMEARK